MMADRVMRGSRLGAVSYETERNHDLAPRQTARSSRISRAIHLGWRAVDRAR